MKTQELQVTVPAGASSKPDEVSYDSIKSKTMKDYLHWKAGQYTVKASELKRQLRDKTKTIHK